MRTSPVGNHMVRSTANVKGPMGVEKSKGAQVLPNLLGTLFLHTWLGQVALPLQGLKAKPMMRSR